MTRTVLALSALAVLLATSPSMAETGDATRGEAIAQQQCARCHDVSRGGAFKKMPPSFQAIAIYRTEPDIWARIIAPSPHAAMPEMTWALTPQEVQDVLAYIRSLDGPVTIQGQ